MFQIDSPPNLLLNILPSTAETKISYVIPGTKPRVVRLSIKPTGSLAFMIGGMRRKGPDLTIHVELGGLTGVVAPIIGKEPPDYHIWLQSGTPPAFVREEGPVHAKLAVKDEYTFAFRGHFKKGKFTYAKDLWRRFQGLRIPGNSNFADC
jgi:hypothetical protein